MRVILAALLLVPVAAAAQSSLVITPTGTQNGQPAASMSDVVKSGQGKVDVLNGAITSPNISGLTTLNGAPFTVQLGTPTIQDHPASWTYFGQDYYPLDGSIQTPRQQISCSTRGWERMANCLSVQANKPAGRNGGGMGGFYYPLYRTVYPGQDMGVISASIDGITPVASGVSVASFTPLNIINSAGAVQTVQKINLTSYLNSTERAAILAAATPPTSSPMRVETNNSFFAFVIPVGYKDTSGNLVPPVAPDGSYIVVDDWVRAIQPSNSSAPNLPGSVAAGPASVTGREPSSYGQTNSDAVLSAYTVTIDVGRLAEVFNASIEISDADTTNAAYISEEGISNGKASYVPNETIPTSDMPLVIGHFLNGDNAGGAGSGVVGIGYWAGTGVKRALVCANPQSASSEGGTSCATDIGSLYGYRSIKSTGYVVTIDPGATGSPLAVWDAQGNIHTNNQIQASSGSSSVTLNGNGTLNATGNIASTGGTLIGAGWSARANNGAGAQTAYADGQSGNVITSGFFAPGNFTVAAEPGCNASYLGAHIYLTDARKPGETAGNGSGVPADCTPITKGGSPQWVSIYDHIAAGN